MRHPTAHPLRSHGGQDEAISLSISRRILEPLVAEIVRQVVEQLEQIKSTLPDRVAFTEAEAAALLGLESHQLRDERHRGRVRAYVISGRRVRYAREDLIAYLKRREWTEETARRWPNGRPGETAGNGSREAGILDGQAGYDRPED
jgi:hypothetical protein